MNKIHVTVIFCLVSFSLFSQESKIENTRVKISPSADSLIVKYDLNGKQEAFNLKLELLDQNNGIIHPQNITGDVGNGIKPGKEKSIIWDMKSDGTDLSGSQLKVRVTGNILIPKTGLKRTLIPWLYIAAGASAVTGTYAYLRANRLYESYPSSSNTIGAENIHSQVDRNLTVSRVAYVATAVFGMTGLIVHIKHTRNKNKKSLVVNYLPLKDVNLISLTYNF